MLSRLSPGAVRCTYNSGFLDCRMLDKCALYFERADAITRRFYYVIVPAHEPEESVLIGICLVPGVVPAVDKRFFIFFGVIQVLYKKTGRWWVQEIAILPSSWILTGLPSSSWISTFQQGEGFPIDPGSAQDREIRQHSSRSRSGRIPPG